MVTISNESLLAAWEASGEGLREYHRNYLQSVMSYNAFWGRIYRARQDRERVQGVAAPLPNWMSGLGGNTVPRIAVYDIECTALEAVGLQGIFVCGCIKELGGEITTIAMTFEDKGEDYRAVAAFVEALSEYEFLIGHNTHAFDMNWLHTRATLHYGLPFPRWYSFDTYQAARTLAVKSRKSLAALCDFFDLPTVKTAIYPNAWNNVRSQQRDVFEAAMKDIIYHCEQDVIANELLYHRLAPAARNSNTPVAWKKTKFG